ncbi:MAG TPA: VacJ family lipoprotein [Steroidobacteraceae bacterium]|nr:VacJ family lipoprotein [Steroidobacteraceae bacterium]
MRSAVITGGMLLALGGCASQAVSIRKVPDQTPAADSAAAAASATAFAEAIAAESANATSAQVPGEEAAPPLTPADAPPMYTYDPWERFNRLAYRFNARFDEALFLPVANTYRRAPGPLRAGVHNFFGNIAEIDSVINYTLQWRLKYGLRSVERFVINSTVGIGGLIDVATKLKLPGTATGFATTLAKWGMHPGPYLVIPLLGPSTLRDGVGFLADYGAEYAINIAGFYRGGLSWGLGTINVVDQRANIDFRYYSGGSPFEYETIRFLYVRRRLIEDAGLHAKDRPKPPPADAPAGK